MKASSETFDVEPRLGDSGAVTHLTLVDSYHENKVGSDGGERLRFAVLQQKIGDNPLPLFA